MNINALSGSNSIYPPTLPSSSLSTAKSTSGSTGSATGVSLGDTQDTNQLSPFAQLLGMLQQLQQSDPAKYRYVTQQIAANLQNAAQTATADGNTTAATQLNQLAADFTNASQRGQLPNMQDMAQAVSGGHHHHGHHMHATPIVAGKASIDFGSSSGSSNSTTGSSANSTNLIAQFLGNSSAVSSSQNNALNPMAIIRNTLSRAGITTNS